MDELLAHAGWLRGLAQRLVGEAGADDVVQEVWLRAAQRTPRTVASPRGWLRATLRSILVRRVERQSAARAREREVARPERLPSAAELAGRADGQRRLVEALLALDDPYRRTVLLRYFEHRSIAEIALDYGDPESTVRTRMARALDQLREELDRGPGGRESWLSGMLLLATPERVANVSVLTLGSLAVWKTVVAVVSVCMLAWFGKSLLVEGDVPAVADGIEAPDAGSAAPETPPDDGVRTVETSVNPEERVAFAVQPAAPQVEATAAEPLTGLFVSGRVLDPSGAPVEGATVYEGTLAQVALSLRNENNARRPSAVTGAGGLFRLELESAGTMIVSAWAEGFSASEERTVELSRASVPETVDLHLRVGATLSGIAYGIDGLPVAGRRVQASCTGIGEFRELTTDEAGAFELGALSPGTWLAATFPGEEELAAAGKSTDVGTRMSYLSQMEVTLLDGGTQEIALGLGAADSPRVSGRLLHAGQPVAGMLQWYPAARPTEKKVSMVGADGAYSMELPHPGLWILHANTTSKAVNSRGQRRLLELAPRAALELDVDLRGGTLTGRVLDTKGAPLAGIRLELRSVAGAPHQPEPTLGGDSERSDADGRYRFDLLLPGTYVAVASGTGPEAEGARFGAAVSEPVTVQAAGTVAASDLVLSGGSSVEIHVVDALGRPVGASIYFHDAAGNVLNPSTQTRANGEGHAQSPTLPPGPVWITAVHRTGASPAASVEVGVDERVELKIGPPLWIEIATDDDVVDPTDGHISVTDVSGRRWGGLVDIRHIFDSKPEREHPERPLFGALPMGTYTVRFEAGGVTRSDVLELSADSPVVSTARVQ